MHVERRVSGRFVEWLFGAARGEPVARALRADGLDLDRIDADYPAEKVSSWLQVLSSSLHPSVPPGEALRRVGFEAVTRVAKGGPLDDVMSRLPAKLEKIGNFFEVSIRPAGAHRYVAHFDDVAALPTFFLGFLQGVTSVSTTADTEVVWSPSGLSGARYVVKANF